jgi:hypothetical protein
MAVENGLKNVHPFVPAAAWSCAAVRFARDAADANAQFGPPKPASAFWNRSPRVSVPPTLRSYSL